MFRLAFLAVLLIASPALADDQVTPLAQQGSWIAMSHSASMTAAADVCIAADPTDQIGFRADNNDIEFRVSDSSWTLPAAVTGTITINVGDQKLALDIAGNTSSEVTAVLTTDQLQALVAEMDKASSMTVTTGNASRTVSLDGSNTVLTAFLTCADIQPPSGSAGSNPFQTAPAGQ